MNPSLSKREMVHQHWREQITAWQASRQSQRKFCKDRQLGYASFRRWRQIFKAEDSKEAVTSTRPVRFLTVKVQEQKASTLAILIQDDLRIEVAAGFNPHLLQQVIQVLRAS